MHSYDIVSFTYHKVNPFEVINPIYSFREEFDVVPVTEAKNRSPVIHISHNLGIEVWCIKPVFMYCYENYFKLEPMWKKEYLKLEKYTRVALLLNPNVATFWNTRKRLIGNQLLDTSGDYILTRLVLSQKPKCVEALSHRRWLLQQNTSETGWIDTELLLCDKIANRMKCNYHAWSHRQWVFSQAILQQGFSIDLWGSEFETMDTWTKFHLSDHSGWHYRKFLLEQLKKHLDKIEDSIDYVRKVLKNHVSDASSLSQLFANLLNEELRKNEDLIVSFSAHETLWYYRRFVLQAGVPADHSESAFLEKCLTVQKQSQLRNPNSGDDVQKRYLEQHRRWLSDFF